MIGTINDPRMADACSGVFGKAAGAVREFVSDSMKASDRGERSVREDSYTDGLLKTFRNSIKAAISDAAQTFGNGQVEIEFEATNLPVNDETTYGADIAVRLEISSPRAKVTKAVLFQCKRMYKDGQNLSFDRLRVDGEKQCRDMLRITPASFFMLYSGGDQIELAKLVLAAARTACPMGLAFSTESCPEWNSSENTAWDLGITVLPASRVLGWSVASKAAGNPMPVDAATVLRGCCPFGIFMVDLLGSCYVGDPREVAVRIATPPKLRERLIPILGISDPDDGFPVRQYMTIRVSTLDEGS